MEGVAERERRAMEKIVAQAWWNANLEGAGGKLRGLKYYLDMLKPRKPQTGEDVLAVFQEYQARGAPIQIKLVRPEEVN